MSSISSQRLSAASSDAFTLAKRDVYDRSFPVLGLLSSMKACGTYPRINCERRSSAC